MNLFRKIKALHTPPCHTCVFHVQHPLGGYGETPLCKSPSYLDHEEKIKTIRYKRAEAPLVRGSRFCKYIEKMEKADKDE